MEVGDFFCKGMTIRCASANANAAGKRYGRKFSCSSMEGGMRTWRIA